MAGSNDNQLVIVALPADDDPVWKYSSEKAPHLTLLYLGDNNFSPEEFVNIEGYVEHASTLLNTFYLDVEDRGTLGDKNADVLFFSKKWSQQIQKFRSNLLQNNLINKAYLSADQFPEWTPHLTMGYPENPAKEIVDGKIYSVYFDRIALWIGDSIGPTFQLKRPEYDLEVAMSQIQAGRDFLQHYGVKGMKWGVRRSDSGSGGSSTAPAQTHPMSPDAKAVLNSTRKIHAGGTAALSNQELQHLVGRLNLEQQYQRLTQKGTAEASSMATGHEAVKTMLSYGKTVNDVHKFMESPTGKFLKNGIKVAAMGAKIYAGGPAAAATVGTGLAVRVASNHFTNVGN